MHVARGIGTGKRQRGVPAKTRQDGHVTSRYAAYARHAALYVNVFVRLYLTFNCYVLRSPLRESVVGRPRGLPVALQSFRSLGQQLYFDRFVRTMTSIIPCFWLNIPSLSWVSMFFVCKIFKNLGALMSGTAAIFFGQAYM